MGEGESGMIWENGTEIRIISYMERVASPGSVHDAGCLGLVRWEGPGGWYGEGGGKILSIIKKKKKKKNHCV